MTFLFVAYTVVWVVLFLYLLSLSGRQKRIDREIESLRQAIDDKKRRPT